MQKEFKSHFSIFKKFPELVYLDNAATTQRPEEVVQRVSDFQSYENSNIHRGVYDLSNKASANFEAVRKKAANFLGVSNQETIAFTSGTTEGMNIIARSYLPNVSEKGDNIVVTIMEHHANLIPWQMASQKLGLELRVCRTDKNGDLDLKNLQSLIDKKTKLLTVNHISNTLGTVNPVVDITEIAHQLGIPVMLDAAQSVAFYNINQGDLQYDFLALSGHKMFGPFGTGILYASEDFHEKISPYNYGGGIIKEVTVQETKFRNFPFHLDAGTPNVEGIIGLGAAIDFLRKYKNKDSLTLIEDLAKHGEALLSGIPGISLLGKPTKRTAIWSFTVDGVHPHDVASFLNSDNIAVRAGMHCTQPLLDSMEVTSAVRASASLYNSKEDLEKLQNSLIELIKFWS